MRSGPGDAECAAFGGDDVSVNIHYSVMGAVDLYDRRLRFVFAKPHNACILRDLKSE